MVDAIAEAEGISINTVNFKAQIGKGTFKKKFNLRITSTTIKFVNLHML